MNKQRKRLLIIAGALAIIAVIVVLLLMSKKSDESETGSYQKIHNNMQNSWVNGNDIYFYSGSFFAKYNLTSEKTERLSDYLLIDQDISNLQWSKEGVLFNSKQTSQSHDDLSLSLDRQNIADGPVYWWWYDFASKQYQILQNANNQSCLQLLRFGQDYICAPLDLNKQQPVSIRSVGTKQSEIYKSDDVIRDMKTSGNYLYFVTTSNDGTESIHTFNLESKSETSNYQTKSRVASYSGDKNGNILTALTKIVKDKDSDEPHFDGNEQIDYTAVYHSEGKDKIKKSIKTSNLTVQLNEDQLGAVTASGSVYEIKDSKLRIAIRDEDGSESSAERSYVGSALANDTHYLLTNTQELYATQYSNPLKLRELVDFDSQADNDEKQPFFVNTPQNDGSSNVQIYSGDLTFAQTAERVDSILKQDYYDPSTFKFSWLLEFDNSDNIILPNVTTVQ